jgi:hypothetical protein
MPRKSNAPADNGEGATCLLGGDTGAYSGSAPAEQPTIHLTECVFGGRFVVSIEPRRVDRPSREFRTYGEARTLADGLRLKHGWAVVDKAGGDHG